MPRLGSPSTTGEHEAFQKLLSAYKRLGITPKDLIAQFLDQGGRLKREEYMVLWYQMANSKQTAATFISLLMDRLMDVLEGKKTIDFSPQVLVNSVYMVSLLLSDVLLQSPRALAKALERWKANHAVFKAKCPSFGDVFRVLSGTFLPNPEPQIAERAVIDSLVIQATTLHSQAEFYQLSDSVLFPTFFGQSPSGGEFSHVYSHLTSLMDRSEDFRSKVFSITLLKLRTLPSQARAAPEMAQTTMLAVFHLIRLFISHYRFKEGALLVKAIEATRGFYLWPKPFGDIARELLDVLKRELSAPGIQMLGTFDRDSRFPEVVGFDDRHGRKARPVYYIVDSDFLGTSVFDELLRLTPAKDVFVAGGDSSSQAAAAPRTGSDPAAPAADAAAAGAGEEAVVGWGVKPEPAWGTSESIGFGTEAPDAAAAADASAADPDAEEAESLLAAEPDAVLEAGVSPPSYGLEATDAAMLLLHILSMDFSLTDEDVARVRMLTPDQILYMVELASTALRSHCMEPPEQAAAARKEDLKELLKEIHEVATSNADDSPSIELPEEFPADFVPPQPALAHLSLPSLVSYSLTRKPGSHAAVPRVAVAAHMERILRRLQQFADVNAPARARFVIAGGDQLLHVVICAFTQLRFDHAELFEGLEVDFHLLPLQPSRMAAFIARQDSWYFRHVYLPCTLARSGQLFMPQVPAEESSVAAKEEAAMSVMKQQIPLPSRAFRSFVETYVRDSQFATGITLFSVDCWNDAPSATSGPEPDVTIPMAQFFSMGVEAEAQHYMVDSKVSTLQAALTDKMFVGSDAAQQELMLTYAPVNALGQILRSGAPDADARFHAVRLFNVPWPTEARQRASSSSAAAAPSPGAAAAAAAADAANSTEGGTLATCLPADPTSPFLYLSASSADKKPPLRRVGLNRDRRTRVTTVEVACMQAKRCRVVVDGSVFGPFNRVRVSFLLDRRDCPLTFPLQTFMPIQPLDA